MTSLGTSRFIPIIITFQLGHLHLLLDEVEHGLCNLVILSDINMLRPDIRAHLLDRRAKLR